MTAEKWMKIAVRLSLEKMRAGEGGPFGALIVKDGRVVAEGWNRVLSSNDPTAHAEVVAIRRACERLGSFELKGCELYASCEPCPMCLAAAYWARVDRIYYANTRTDAAAAGFDDDHIYKEIPKNPEDRSIPMERVELMEAPEAFREWLAKMDKVSY